MYFLALSRWAKVKFHVAGQVSRRKPPKVLLKCVKLLKMAPCSRRSDIRWPSNRVLRLMKAAVLGLSQVLKLNGKILAPQGHDWWMQRANGCFGMYWPPNPHLKTANFLAVIRQRSLLLVSRAEPSILLIGQPTRGVDIGAIEKIPKTDVKLRDSGKAILFGCLLNDEIMALSDRILVDVWWFAIVAKLDAKTLDERNLGSNDGECSKRRRGVRMSAGESSCLVNMRCYSPSLILHCLFGSVWWILAHRLKTPSKGAGIFDIYGALVTMKGWLYLVLCDKPYPLPFGCYRVALKRLIHYRVKPSVYGGLGVGLGVLPRQKPMPFCYCTFAI